jgi:branched-chain amino acid aminotransferase
MPISELASVDGEISPTAEATITLPDDGLYRGDGVFEVIRLYSGEPFALAEHLDRLERSAASIELPVEREAIESELEALLAELGNGEAQLRIILTRGGRRILLTEGLPERGHSARIAIVTYSPTVILTGVKSLS